MYYTPTQLKPLLRISLERFVPKYNDILNTQDLIVVKNIINRYNEGKWFNTNLIEQFVDFYSNKILPIQEFNFHINEEDGNCHLSFFYQSGERLLDIRLVEGFHFTERFNLATAEDVFNLICDFQLEVQRVRHDLEFKKY